ncbi:hypothetical protein ACFLWS_08115 [Chloroflexota bacterium]
MMKHGVLELPKMAASSALYKRVYGNARFKRSQELKQAKRVGAFFVNDHF